MSQTQVQSGFIGDNSVTTAKLDSTVSGALVPIGGIIMWSGITVPTGWSLCNGANGTPNLRNKFIVAADSLTKTGTTSQVGSSPYDPGDTGGSANATLVSHNHTGTTGGHSADHSHGGVITSTILSGVNNPQVQGAGIVLISRGGQYNAFVTDGYLPGSTGGTSTNHTHSFTTSTEGSAATNANLPPYYALAFIMRVS
jgi:hypothetical protein